MAGHLYAGFCILEGLKWVQIACSGVKTPGGDEPEEILGRERKEK